MAAEPIFVTPPTHTKTEKAGGRRDPVGSALDEIPLAQTVPVGQKAPIEKERPRSRGGHLPIFVPSHLPTRPSVNPSIEARAALHRRLPETKVEDTRKPPPVKPGVASGKKEGIPDVEVPAAFVNPGVGAVTDSISETETMVQLGLGLAPVKVKSKLPGDLNLLRIKLANVVTVTGTIPEKEGQSRLCRDAGEIETLTKALSRTPLIEVTTHFTLWRSAMEKLNGSVQSLRQRCRKPSGKAVDAFRNVVKRFTELVDSR